MSSRDHSSILSTDLNSILEAAPAATTSLNRSGQLVPLDTMLKRRSPMDVVVNPRILIVDDEPINIKVVKKFLAETGYTDFITTTEPTQAIGLLEEQQPDLLLLDIMMPGMSGLDILREMSSNHNIADIPTIVLTASTDKETRSTALRLGATDFINKPIDPVELLPRVRNVLVVKAHHDHLRFFAWELELEVSMRTAELVRAQSEAITCLARAAEFRDDETGKHVQRVGRYVELLAGALGMERRVAQILGQAATLHDIGKIGVPDALLKKPGRFDPAEREAMQRHCETAGAILADTVDLDEHRVVVAHTNVGADLLATGRSPILKIAARIALTHHEKWDGTGYPMGLKGEQIPLEGRLTAIADVFDALSSDRPYRQALPVDECFKLMQAERGLHFDPTALDAFCNLATHICAIREQAPDEELVGASG